MAKFSPHLPFVHRIFLWEVFPFKKCWRILPLSPVSSEKPKFPPSQLCRILFPPPTPPPSITSQNFEGEKEKPTVLYTARESNINVLFRFMYSQKIETVLPRYLQNRIICNVLFRNFYIHVSVNDLYVSRISLPILLHPNRHWADRSWEYINRSQINECTNWEWGPRSFLSGST